jgi:hypothetical protein
LSGGSFKTTDTKNKKTAKIPVISSHNLNAYETEYCLGGIRNEKN